jgi:imidazolonepropionase-like amidohydrolase
MSLEQVLSFSTRNPASALKLEHKGEIKEGNDADVLILQKGSLEIRDVIAEGKSMVRDGRVLVQEKFLEKSYRDIHMRGANFDPDTGALARAK